MIISTDFLTWFFIGYCLIYNLLLCVVFLFGPKRQTAIAAFPNPKAADHPPLPRITIMIPALNEESVIEQTIASLLSIPYAGCLEVLVIDDCSQDGTLSVARRLCSRSPAVSVLERTKDRCHMGKGDVLNQGFSHLLKGNPHQDLSQWIIGVFDADGCIVEDDFYAEVAKAFCDPAVGATQCGVRILNRDHHLLAALQDVEFATFSFVTQSVRDTTTGAVALGGNGQFIRASELKGLSQERGAPWNPAALTEDLDIGVRLLMNGARIRFIQRHVAQEGLQSFKLLFKQRHRWAWGSLQTFMRYVVSGEVLKHRMPWLRKLDLLYYLSFWIVPFVVLISMGLTLLGFLGWIQVTNSFSFAWMVFNGFSFVPMMVLGMRSARIAAWKIPHLVFLTTLYSFHWVPALAKGWVSILAGQEPTWIKTKRLREVMGQVQASVASTQVAPDAKVIQHPTALAAADDGRGALLNGFHGASARRIEFKYVLPARVADQVSEQLQKFLALDPHCQQQASNRYTVRSIYFDSPGFSCFHEKLNGQQVREKFRIRTYDQLGQTPIFLEYKAKRGLASNKKKIALTKEQLAAIAAGEYGALMASCSNGNAQLVDRLFSQIYRKAYGPAVLVVYERQAFVCEQDDSIRATMDTNVRAAMYPELCEIYRQDGLENVLDGQVILEIKFKQFLPRWLHALTTQFQIKPQACSKYCTSVAYFIAQTPMKQGSIIHAI